MELCAALWSGSGQTSMSRIAIVAALEREVRPLIRAWKVSTREYGGRQFRVFEQGDVVLVCGGIGAEAARRAAAAVIALFAPERVYSVGFAGALDPALKVGDLVRPACVINASDGSRMQLASGSGSLVSFGSVASAQQKMKLRESFSALAVDMEAASVARATEVHGIGFAVLKAISDASDFELPPMDRFVRVDGTFSELRFALFSAIRPWIWPQVLRLARNSGVASRALCEALRSLGSHQISKEQNSSAI
jgi:adenosylhomocysteine nucleosidase